MPLISGFCDAACSPASALRWRPFNEPICKINRRLRSNRKLFWVSHSRSHSGRRHLGRSGYADKASIELDDLVHGVVDTLSGRRLVFAVVLVSLSAKPISGFCGGIGACTRQSRRSAHTRCIRKQKGKQPRWIVHIQRVIRTIPIPIRIACGVPHGVGRRRSVGEGVVQDSLYQTARGLSNRGSRSKKRPAMTSGALLRLIAFF